MIFLPFLALLSNLDLCGKDPQLIIGVAHNMQGTYIVTQFRNLQAKLLVLLLRYFLQLFSQPFGDVVAILRDPYTITTEAMEGTTHGLFFGNSDIKLVDDCSLVAKGNDDMMVLWFDLQCVPDSA